jgi:hypothetical protein
VRTSNPTYLFSVPENKLTEIHFIHNHAIFLVSLIQNGTVIFSLHGFESVNLSVGTGMCRNYVF